MGDVILILALGVTALLNIWVWIFPNTFINFLRSDAKSVEPPLRQYLMKLINIPGYIWLPRIVFGAGLILLIYVSIVT